jgi:predicted GNAT family N-acyltransferase
VQPNASPAALELDWAPPGEPPEQALSLRLRVFCEEQGVSREEELDGRDGDALHLIARAGAGGPVVGTLRLLVDGDRAKIGRVAVEPARRRQGIALQMLRLALERAQELGCSRARLAAQVEAVELYRRAGFAVESEPFMEAGIEHVWMGRGLGS